MHIFYSFFKTRNAVQNPVGDQNPAFLSTKIVENTSFAVISEVIENTSISTSNWECIPVSGEQDTFKLSLWTRCIFMEIGIKTFKSPTKIIKSCIEDFFCKSNTSFKTGIKNQYLE